MKLLRFKRFQHENTGPIFEGGNVVLKTGETAQKIPMELVNRSELKPILLQTMKALNQAFEKQVGHPLWKRFDELVKDLKLFSGSSRLFFSDKISDDMFKTHKKMVGDLDTMYNKAYEKELKDFLIANTGVKMGPCRYVDEGGNSPTQFNTLFELPKEYWNSIRYFQVDFEPIDYNDAKDEPSDFSLFAHYSSWKDIKEGIKGAFSKYLYRSIFGNIEKIENYVILTGTGKVSKSAAFEKAVGKYKFSVDRGVRLGYAPVIDPETGKQQIVDGKFAYKETDKGDYEQDMNVLFNMAFGKVPNESELRLMHAFTGSLDLMERLFDKKKIESIFLHFVQLCWAKGAQGFERGNPELDFENKKAAYDQFLARFPYLKGHDQEIQTMIEEYYKGYKR